MEGAGESLTDKIQRLKDEKAALTTARKAAQKALRKETRRMARIKAVINKISHEDLNQCLQIARAQPHPKAKASATKAAARAD